MRVFNNISILAAIVLFLSVSCDPSTRQMGSARKNKPQKVVSVPFVNADSAFAFVAEQVAFGPRVPGTDAHSQCGNWLKAKLESYADTVILQRFKARTYDNITRNGINFIASFQPEKTKRLLLMAHWDSRPFADHDPDEAKRTQPIDGANDGASGVGVLLEMARHFKVQPPDVGIDIILFDLEDWGPPAETTAYNESYWGLGAQHWSKSPHKAGYKASYGILLDMVGAEDPSFRKEYFSKQYARFVIDLVWNTAADLGYSAYFLDEDGIATTDDHYFVNKYAKIPSIDIIHLENNASEGSFFEHWHTSEDNLEKISPESLRMVGEVVMNVVYYE